jgi:hypothetical protein
MRTTAELSMKKRLAFPIGTRVIAVRDFGPVKEGAPGIITGTADMPFLWMSRPVYLCTFADNMKIAARHKEVDDFDHGYNLTDLERPDFSRVMAERAQAELADRTRAGHR